MSKVWVYTNISDVDYRIWYPVEFVHSLRPLLLKALLRSFSLGKLNESSYWNLFIAILSNLSTVWNIVEIAVEDIIPNIISFWKI